MDSQPLADVNCVPVPEAFPLAPLEYFLAPVKSMAREGTGLALLSTLIPLPKTDNYVVALSFLDHDDCLDTRTPARRLAAERLNELARLMR
jgi:hypothetical protein